MEEVKVEVKEEPSGNETTQLKKTTTFKGRLGYACLNTILRKQKPPIFSSRTCRLATLKEKGMDYVWGLALENAKDILPMLKWNEEHNIRFMRLSSEMFPFASHPEFGYKLEDIPGLKEILKETGDWAREHGHRLTMHPGQFTQLGSPTVKVVTNSILDLSYQASLLDLIGLGKDSVMILHMGGVYGDKSKVYERFEKNWTELVPQNVKDRLVLENDEMCYSVEDLLPISLKHKIPIVLDWHHDSINPSSNPPEYYLPQINSVWEERGIKPKQHYSEGREGAITPSERRGHSSRVKSLPPCYDDTDLMIEAKDKEMAVFELYKIYDLFPVDDSIMYPDTNIQVKKRGPKKVKKEEVEVEELELKKGSKPKTKKVVRKKVIVKEGDEHDVYGEDMGIVQEENKAKKPRSTKSKVKAEEKKEDSPSSEPKEELEEVVVDEIADPNLVSAEKSSERRKRNLNKPNYKENEESEEEPSTSNKSFSSRRKVRATDKIYGKKQSLETPKKQTQQTD